MPASLHWVYPGAPGEPLPYWAYLHACAAADVLSPDTFYFHHPRGALPSGRWWRAARAAANLTLVPSARVDSVYGRPVTLPAHASDVTRLTALLSAGGTYLDTDVLPLRPFAPLRVNPSVILGVQSAGRTANAVLLSPAGAPFLRRWLDGYHDFSGADWDAFSVRLPAALAQRHPREALWLTPGAWFTPGPDDAPGAALFERNMSDAAFAARPDAFAQHLWHKRTSAQLAAVTGPGWFRERPRTLYARMVRGLAESGRCPRVAAALREV